VLQPEALRLLAAVPRKGGTLIGVQVRGGGLNEVFGFDEAVDSRQRIHIEFAGTDPLLAPLTETRERRLMIGRRDQSADTIGTVGYTNNAAPLAQFEDGTAAVTSKAYESGRTYAIGLDLGFLLLKGYNNRGEELVHDFNNRFDPSLDVWLRMLARIYRSSEEGAVTLGTVPSGKSLSVVLTHDVDFTQSLQNAVEYAEYERSQGLVATYFIQTKYVRDYNDDAYFNEKGVGYLERLAELGVELGSHTIAHSAVFSKFPLGTGRESYPEYVPYVKDLATTYNGSILGELRVSKYLIEHFSRQTVSSFRPGYLSNPTSLPQALQATGYRFSSSATANNSLTHLPYQLNYDRLARSEVDVFEFPVTIEDEASPKLGDRLPEALEVARQVGRYGGLCVILIHPNILDHKLVFEKRFVEAVRPQAWIGSVGQFGQWWAARNRVQLDVVNDSPAFHVTLIAPETISGLTIEVPAGWQFQQSVPRLTGIEQQETKVVLPLLQGTHTLHFKRRPVPALARNVPSQLDNGAL
jgi:peptidoglycan/xylan/chitin deacetylase (PgdA/CDA1 family)